MVTITKSAHDLSTSTAKLGVCPKMRRVTVTSKARLTPKSAITGCVELTSGRGSLQRALSAPSIGLFQKVKSRVFSGAATNVDVRIVLMPQRSRIAGEARPP
jgi:hypothetical protein